MKTSSWDVCYSDRDVARIAVVDEAEDVFFHAYVKPEKEIVSYLTQLTGITERYEETLPTGHRALIPHAPPLT